MDVARLASGVAEATHAARSAATRALTLADVPVLDQVVAEWPAARPLAIGRSLLADARVESSPIMRGPLAAIRSGLAPITTEDVGVATLLKSVRDSLDQEIGRIDGTVETVGLAGHPVYENVGAMRTNLSLLEALSVI